MAEPNLIDRIKKIDRGNLLLIVLIFAVFTVTALTVILALTGNTIQSIFTKPNEFELLTPGKATIEDVKRIKGEPESIERRGSDTHLNYKTQSEDYKNTITIEENKVKYSIENVFSSEKGFLSDYKTKYGEPDFIVYDKEDDVVAWNIFLKAGLGIATFGEGEIARILYFEPQNKESFLKNVGSALGFQSKKPVHPDE